MSEAPEIGTIFEQPGFRGVVIGVLEGLVIVGGQLNGQVPAHAGERDEFAVVMEGEIVVQLDGKA